VHGLDTFIYGALLVLFIIYMPSGILGKLGQLWRRRPAAPPSAPARARS
jgi:ABC-type branched-subunit amino acid transport system permease subunit